MNRFLSFIALSLFFTGCNKQNIDASQNQTINCAPLAIDPVNLSAASIYTKKDVSQTIYPAIELQKGMSGILADVAITDISKYQFHVYIFSAGRYYLLPNYTTGNNSYKYSIQNGEQAPIINILRSTGVTENLDAIVVVAVSLSYLQNQAYTIDYRDMATVKAALGLP